MSLMPNAVHKLSSAAMARTLMQPRTMCARRSSLSTGRREIMPGGMGAAVEATAWLVSCRSVFTTGKMAGAAVVMTGFTSMCIPLSRIVFTTGFTSMCIPLSALSWQV